MITIKQKTEWVAALRSGRYEQGSGELVDDFDRYCCLGVLGVVCGIKKEALVRSSHLSKVNRDDLLGSWGAGFYDSEAPDTLKTIQRKLAAMNDNGATFDAIAAWIEAYVPTEEAPAVLDSEHR